MKKYIHKLHSIFCFLGLLFIVLCFTGCGKIDKNGDLDGMWQLTELENLTTHTIEADKNNGIYWNVQLDILNIKDRNNQKEYYCRFNHNDNLLTITNCYRFDNGIEVIPEVNDMLLYAFDGNNEGYFTIEQLSNEHLILKTDNYRLIFRKY